MKSSTSSTCLLCGVIVTVTLSIFIQPSGMFNQLYVISWRVSEWVSKLLSSSHYVKNPHKFFTTVEVLQLIPYSLSSPIFITWPYIQITMIISLSKLSTSLTVVQLLVTQHHYVQHDMSTEIFFRNGAKILVTHQQNERESVCDIPYGLARRDRCSGLPIPVSLSSAHVSVNSHCTHTDVTPQYSSEQLRSSQRCRYSAYTTHICIYISCLYINNVLSYLTFKQWVVLTDTLTSA